MIVYRICKKEEIDKIFHDRSFQNVGKVCERNERTNTHLYVKNKKYMHFFKDKESIFYLETTKDMFICTYDIPNYLLEKHSGVGFYYDMFNFKNLEEVSEYAIESELINYDYLLKVEEILEYIDIEEYMDGDVSSRIKTIYLNRRFINKLSNEENCNKILRLYNILMASNIKASINLKLNDLINLIPEIKYMIGFEHKHPHHHLDVFEHTLYALSMADKDFDLRLSLLLHDIGKPFSFSEKDGVRHFYNHPNVSSLMSKIILARLGFNEEYIAKICYLIKYHDTPIEKKDINNNYNLIFTRYLMQECDALAHNPDKLEKRKKYLASTKQLILKK